MNHETEQILFTEHNLETRIGEEEPNLQNQEEKSFILAPFNSVKSIFIDQGNQIKEIKKDDPPFKWPKEVTDLLEPRRIVKFSTKCRDKNSIYEQNNYADLDNGVYNELVNEQEREEGALLNNDQAKESQTESPHQARQNVSEIDSQELFDDDASEDSLERSFRETELASDDEQAAQQVVEQMRLNSAKKPNEEAQNFLQNS